LEELMRAVVQRVAQAVVLVRGEVVGRIEKGLLVYVGVAVGDTSEDVAYLTDKIRHLRVFPDEANRLNRNVAEVDGSVLLVSAFTVQADARKGRRPSFDAAAPPDVARAMYEQLHQALASRNVRVAVGAFQETMDVQSVNAGPVCVLLDSRRIF
jgi:D-tyrosyl-tRNA(Tyr) deacylase